jgi:hypothetical protein
VEGGIALKVSQTTFDDVRDVLDARTSGRRDPA